MTSALCSRRPDTARETVLPTAQCIGLSPCNGRCVYPNCRSRRNGTRSGRSQGDEGCPDGVVRMVQPAEVSGGSR